MNRAIRVAFIESDFGPTPFPQAGGASGLQLPSLGRDCRRPPPTINLPESRECASICACGVGRGREVPPKGCPSRAFAVQFESNPAVALGDTGPFSTLGGTGGRVQARNSLRLDCLLLFIFTENHFLQSKVVMPCLLFSGGFAASPKRAGERTSN